MKKEDLKKNLYVIGKMSGQGTRVALGALLSIYIIGWSSCFLLDLIEREEDKKKLKNHNNNKK